MVNNETTKAPGDVILSIYAKDGALLSQIALKEGTYKIGRAEECEIVCEGVASISREHAELNVAGGKVFIRDLQSTAGTMVNSKVVQEARIFNGDIIQLGVMKFVLDIPDIVGGKQEHKAFVVTEMKKAVDFDKELLEVAETCRRIKEEVAKVIVGQEEIVEGILVALLSQSHCLLVGVPGLAKTVLVCTFSKVLGLDTQRIQFTPDLMPTDIIGSEVLKKNVDGLPELEFCQGPVFTQLLLADEINRTPPKTQAALLEAMQEHQVTVAMRSYHLPLPFCVIATQNPIEQEGTYPLPEAQQDRFMLCLYLDYPDRRDEIQIIARTTVGDLYECQHIVNQNEIIRFQQTVKNIGVPEAQIAYAVSLIRATRPGSEESVKAKVSDLIDWGAGPRAGQALILGAKALAAIDGRPAVADEDIRRLILPVLRHRISCNYRARAEGLTEKEVIQRIAEQIKP